MSKRSQLQILGLLGTKEQKRGVSPNVWSTLSANPKKNLRELTRRCVSDVEGLIALYGRTKSLIKNITR